LPDSICRTADSEYLALSEKKINYFAPNFGKIQAEISVTIKYVHFEAREPPTLALLKARCGKSGPVHQFPGKLTVIRPVCCKYLALAVIFTR